MSSDETKTNKQNSFGDNFVEGNSTDKNLNLDVDGNLDHSSSSFEPMNDSKEYIGKITLIYFTSGFKGVGAARSNRSESYKC